jgi:hypothetical protein
MPDAVLWSWQKTGGNDNPIIRFYYYSLGSLRQIVKTNAVMEAVDRNPELG